MKNFTWLIGTIMLWSYSAFGQVQLSIEGGVNYVPSASNSENEDREATWFVPLNDSTWLQQLRNVTYQYDKTYTPKVGFEVKGNLRFRVSDRVNVRTGIGLNFLKFEFRSSAQILSATLIQQDTVEATTSFPFNPLECDSIVNSLGDLGPVNNEPTQAILYLQIPITVEYAIIAEKFFIDAGAYIMTPVYANRKREYVSLHREEHAGQVVCEYMRVEENNTSGNSLRDLLMGVSANVSYKFANRFSVKVGVAKDVSNVFVDSDYQQSPYSDEKFNPLRLSFGIEYFL